MEPDFSNNAVRWKLAEHEALIADILSAQQLRKWQTIKVELMEALSEFPFVHGDDTGAVINKPDYWLVRGRYTLACQILNEHVKAMSEREANNKEGSQAAQVEEAPDFSGDQSQTF